jgi:hypothetical protein
MKNALTRHVTPPDSSDQSAVLTLSNLRSLDRAVGRTNSSQGWALPLLAVQGGNEGHALFCVAQAVIYRLSVYICMYTCMYICLYCVFCVCVWAVCVCLCVTVCMYVCILTHTTHTTYTHKRPEWVGASSRGSAVCMYAYTRTHAHTHTYTHTHTHKGPKWVGASSRRSAVEPEIVTVFEGADAG